MALLSELCLYEVIVLTALFDSGDKVLIEENNEEVAIIQGTSTWHRLKQVQNFSIEEKEDILETLQSLKEIEFDFYVPIQPGEEYKDPIVNPVFEKFEIENNPTLKIEWEIRDDIFPFVYNSLMYMSNAIDLEHIREAKSKNKKG